MRSVASGNLKPYYFVLEKSGSSASGFLGQLSQNIELMSLVLSYVR